MIHEVGADDPRLRPYARVGDHAWLVAEGLFVAEGRLVVSRLVETGTYELHSVLVTPAAFAALRGRLGMLRADVFVAPQAAVNAITGFNFHRGCLALAHRPSLPPFDAFLGCQRLLILEGVSNPDNVGGLFRVAAALRADGVLLDARTADPLYRKAIRTSMGAVLRVPFTRMVPWLDALRALARHGTRLIAMTPDPSAHGLALVAASLSKDVPVALLLGSEGSGLTTDALNVAHDRVRIPIAEGTDSLNVVVAAAIALYAFAENR